MKNPKTRKDEKVRGMRTMQKSKRKGKKDNKASKHNIWPFQSTRIHKKMIQNQNNDTVKGNV